MKNNLILVSFIFIFWGCVVYDPPKETVVIVNKSKLDTIYIFSGHCIDRLDSILTPRKYYFDSGFNSLVRNPMFIDPLDSIKLALGYTLLPIINSCEDKEAKVFVINEINFKSIKDKKFFVQEQMIDTIFSLTEKSIKKGKFIYK